jgi:hypothetical protein
MDSYMPRRISALAAAVLLSLPALLWAEAASAQAQSQENLPWSRDDQRYPRTDDGYAKDSYGTQRPYSTRPYDPYADRSRAQNQPQDDAYHPQRGYPDAQRGGDYAQNPNNRGYYEPNSSTQRYGEPYRPYSEDDRRYDARPYSEGPGNTFSSSEILSAGHSFFGSISKGLASVVEFAFQKQGRPNGYILGQDAGGAFVAGLRYGEGMLYTKDAGSHQVYWQGPSIGYDAGAEGSKVMVLVYGLSDPEEVYQRFGGVDGSAYVVGGVGLTFLKNGEIVVAPIRSGVGLRLGANIGYLKYTRKPTWNPF